MLKNFFLIERNENEPEREALTDKSYTHAGVACGCDSNYGDICCIMMGRNVVDLQNGLLDPQPVKSIS